MVEVVLSLAAYLNLQLNFSRSIRKQTTLLFIYLVMLLKAFQTLKLDK